MWWFRRYAQQWGDARRLTPLRSPPIAPAVIALASGEVEIVIASAAALMPQVKAGRA